MKVIVYDLDAEEYEDYEWLYESKKEAQRYIMACHWEQSLWDKPLHTYVIEKYEEVD